MKPYFNYFIVFVLFISYSSCKKEKVRGCMNPDSENYNPEAEVDDGSCIVKGCTDPKSLTYNPKANENDGSCKYVYCPDIRDDNYLPDAEFYNDTVCDCQKTVSKFEGEYIVSYVRYDYGIPGGTTTREYTMLLHSPEYTKYNIKAKNLYGDSSPNDITLKVQGNNVLYESGDYYMNSFHGTLEADTLKINFTSLKKDPIYSYQLIAVKL